MTMDKLKILVCAHLKDDLVRTEDPYVPVFAGHALHPDVDLGFTNDDEGDNISLKNKEYCELTALYWGWKNLKDVEYSGLAHFHRYLDVDVNAGNIDKLMKNCDMLASDMLCNSHIGDSLVSLTSYEDTLLFQDTLLKLHPEYREALIDYFWNSYTLYRCNIFITRKELYDKYCETFFPVFFEVEKRLPKKAFSRQNRAIAYFGEYSLGLFIHHEKLKVKTYQIFENNIRMSKWSVFRWRKLIMPLKTFLFRLASHRNDELPIFYAAHTALERDGVKLEHYKN